MNNQRPAAEKWPDADQFLGSMRDQASRVGPVTKGRSMSIFDDPFDSERELVRQSCVCGQHRSAAEHDYAERTLRCEPVAPP